MILLQVRIHIQAEKRRRVGGPFAALSGGMSNVRVLEQCHPSSGFIGRKDNEGIPNARNQVLETSQNWTWHQPLYFFSKVNTRAETAEFFSVPPTMSGPSGVNAMPCESARTS